MPCARPTCLPHDAAARPCQHPPYFHDGSAKTLDDVVKHYDKVRSLDLTKQQREDLVEYLKTL